MNQQPRTAEEEAIRGLSSRLHDDGYHHFYWNGHDITVFWMAFFSGLSIKEEKHAAWILARKHGKELNRQFPMAPPIRQAT